MKINVWVLSTCVPGESEPCLPSVFSTYAEAEAEAEKMMRSEWQYNGPEDEETNEKLPYPEGGWEEAHEAIKEATSDGDPLWGQWEITSHEVEIEPPPLPPLTLILEGGMIQNILSPDPDRFGGLEVTSIDYDCDGASDPAEVLQGDGTWVKAVVEGWKIELAGEIMTREPATPDNEGPAQ